MLAGRVRGRRDGIRAVLAVFILAGPSGPLAADCCEGTAAAPRAPNPPALPAHFLDQLSSGLICGTIQVLQDFKTRYAYSDRASEAAAYLLGKLRDTGLEARSEDFWYNGQAMSNVMAVLPGRVASAPTYVLGAHHDSLNGTDSYTNPSAPAPGADDDASGVAAVLASAELFSRARTNATVVFAFFGAEEIGRIGSREHVRRAVENRTSIGAAVCLDMIGFNSRFPKVDLVCNAPSAPLSDLAVNVSSRNALGLITEQVFTNSTPDNWSDHLSFWEAGFPAMCLIEDENPTASSLYFDANPHYHTAGDTADRLNLSLMTKVARLGAGTVASLAGLALADFSPRPRSVPRSVLEGERMELRVAVDNRGSPEMAVNVSLEVDGRVVARGSAVPDGKDEAVLSWVASRGVRRVAVRADPDDRCIEWNELDNSVEFDVEVLGRPDLSVQDFMISDPRPVPAQMLHFSVEVGNGGGTRARARVLVVSEEEGAPLVMDAEVDLPAGQWTVLTATAAAPEGETLFTARVVGSDPAELELANNEKNLTVRPHLLDPGSYSLRAVPDVVFTGQPFLVGVEASSPGAPAVECLFDFGDGRGAGWTTAPGVPWAYPSPGVYFVSAVVKDGRGAKTALAPAPVSVLDRPPVAVLSASNLHPSVNETVQFSARGSRDPDGEIIHHAWDFGEGQGALGPSVSRSFATLGPRLVRLTVTDDLGNRSFAELAIYVIDREPVARPSADRKVLFVGERASFSSAGSRDPDGRVVSYLWDLGDGTTYTSSDAEHAYASPGSFRVRLTLTDDLGALGSAEFQVKVYPVPKLYTAEERAQGSWLVPTVLLVLLTVSMGLIYKRPRPRDEEEE